MSRLISLPYIFERPNPPFEGSDIRYPESLARYFIEHYSKAGMRIFDPFAGLGTTLFVAESLKRIPYGIEADDERYEWVAGQLENWNHLICADSLNAAKFGFPQMDMALTSPPFMACNHNWNPLSGKQGNYQAYLRKMKRIFTNLAPILKQNAPLIVQLDNIPGKNYTPLIRDIANCITPTFRQIDEYVVSWEPPKPSYPHTHCLIFKKHLAS